MKYKHIVWDFNGTIIDDVDIGIQCINPILAARGLKLIPDVGCYREKFDFPVKNYYENLGLNFESETYEKIASEWFENYKKLSPTVKPINGVERLLEVFEKCGTEQMILSASEDKILKEKLKELGLYDKFARILSLDNFYAHSKLDIALDYFSGKDEEKPDYLMIGDTTHDAFVAQKSGIDIVLVACGHMPKSRLDGAKCPVYESMDALRSDVENHRNLFS